MRSSRLGGLLVPTLHFAGGYPCCCHGPPPGSTSSVPPPPGSTSSRRPEVDVCIGCIDGKAARQYQIEVAGMMNNACTNCATRLNGTFILDFLTETPACTYRSPTVTVNCTTGPAARPYRFDMQLVAVGSTQFKVELVLVDSITSAVNARWSRMFDPRPFDCFFGDYIDLTTFTSGTFVEQFCRSTPPSATARVKAVL